MASVVEVWRYPVKSMAGERLDSCMVTEQGLEGDRRWALIDQSPNRAGKWFNIKQHAPLMTYRSRLSGDSVDVVAPDHPIRSIKRLAGYLVAAAYDLARIARLTAHYA